MYLLDVFSFWSDMWVKPKKVNFFVHPKLNEWKDSSKKKTTSEILGKAKKKKKWNREGKVQSDFLQWWISPQKFYSAISEQQSDPEDGRVTHGPLSRHRERWKQHQESDAGNWLPHPLPGLEQGQLSGEKQSGSYPLFWTSNGRVPTHRPVSYLLAWWVGTLQRYWMETSLLGPTCNSCVLKTKRFWPCKKASCRFDQEAGQKSLSLMGLILNKFCAQGKCAWNYCCGAKSHAWRHADCPHRICSSHLEIKLNVWSFPLWSSGVKWQESIVNITESVLKIKYFGWLCKIASWSERFSQVVFHSFVFFFHVPLFLWNASLCGLCKFGTTDDYGLSNWSRNFLA